MRLFLHPTLVRLLREHGSVPFSLFMEWALYHPEFGYYASDREIFGTLGDFYTSPSVHSVFSETLADWIWSNWVKAYPNKPLRIVEMGAGTGQLAEGILQTLQMKPDSSTVSYVIIERSKRLQDLQKKRLSASKLPISWAQSIQDLAKAPTVFVSNELLDAFPVELVRRVDRKWEMQYIELSPDSHDLQVLWRPVEQHFCSYLTHLDRIPEGCICEISSTLPEWVRAVDRVVSEGFVVTIDYGGDTDELYGEHHPLGTIRAYVKHQVFGDVLTDPGSRDLTADVDFSFLEGFTHRHGWVRERYEKQGSFLVHAGILHKLQDVNPDYSIQDPNRKRNMAIKQLILPGGMGDAFRVVVHKLPIDRIAMG